MPLCAQPLHNLHAIPDHANTEIPAPLYDPSRDTLISVEVDASFLILTIGLIFLVFVTQMYQREKSEGQAKVFKPSLFSFNDVY